MMSKQRTLNAPFVSLILASAILAAGFPGRAQQPANPEGGTVIQPRERAGRADGAGDAEAPALKFDNTPLDIVLQAYATERGRTLLLAPNVPSANITLRSQQALTRDEYLLAIETVLGMHGVALIDVGDKFVKIVPSKEARRLGISTDLGIEESIPYEERGQTISRMIELQHIDISEAQKIIEGFKRPDGQVQIFERTHSILITDIAENVNRIVEIISYVDQPIINREEANVRPIRFAKASEIKTKLDQIVAEIQKDQEKQAPVETPRARSSGAPGIERREAPSLPGVVRSVRRRRPREPSAPPESSEDMVISSLIEAAERGVIRGKVHIVADDRTNILIVITRPENMTFFDRIISVLDIETAPDVLVEVLRLEYADAEEVAKMLNDLITTQSKGDAAAGAAAAESLSADEGDSDSRSARLAEFVARLRRERAQAEAESGASKIGHLSSDNIKILSNKRTNALIVMASGADMAALRAIIRDMDIMLSQVLIETVILEITLDNKIDTGVEWVQRAMIAYDGSGKEPFVSYAGRGGASPQSPRNPFDLTTTESLVGDPGLAYWLSFFDLNLDVVITAAKSDSRTRILNSPVILTQDNKEAVIEATTRSYFYKGKKYVGGGTSDPVYEDDVEQRDVGLTLKVTPRINAKGFVVMSIEQTVENISGQQTINQAEWPVVTSRKVGADIAVSSGETVLLGGLVTNSKRNSQNKIPLLGDIPLLGWLFRSTSLQDARSEVVVFLTPYVLDSPSELYEDALRRRESLDIGDMWSRGWSDSRLAYPMRPPPDNAEKTLPPEASAPATNSPTASPSGDPIPAPLAEEVRRAFAR